MKKDYIKFILLMILLSIYLLTPMNIYAYPIKNYFIY